MTVFAATATRWYARSAFMNQIQEYSSSCSSSCSIASPSSPQPAPDPLNPTELNNNDLDTDELDNDPNNKSFENNDLDNNNFESNDRVGLPDILFHNVYSENYANNQQNMSSLFLYIPWRPSSPNYKQLKQLTKVVTTQMARSHPGLIDKFNWATYGEPSLSTNKTYGRFSVANLNNFRDHHITLCPNLMGPPYKIDQFIENLQHGISKIPIPSSLIGVDEVHSNHKDTLRRLLFNKKDTSTSKDSSASNNASLQKYIQLHPVAYLKPYASFTSQSLFLALKIEVLPGSPEDQFFSSLRSIIASQQEALDMTWYTARKPDANQNKTKDTKDLNLVEQYNEYHVTLMVGEFKNFNQHFNVTYHMDQLHEFCSQLDLSPFLHDLKFNIDSVGVDTVGHNRIKREFKLKLGDDVNKTFDDKANSLKDINKANSLESGENSKTIISRSIKSKKKNNRQHRHHETANAKPSKVSKT